VIKVQPESTFFDQALALREMRRVLKKGGRLALSDMVVEGDVPEELEDWVNVGTCLAGALRFSGYEEALDRAGFRIVEHWDASEGLHEMIGRIKRNLLGLALAKATGNLPLDLNIDVKEGRALLRTAEQAVHDGVIGYGVYIAERVD
jgi:SAM-dependent methyltransferase